MVYKSIYIYGFLATTKLPYVGIFWSGKDWQIKHHSPIFHQPFISFYNQLYQEYYVLLVVSIHTCSSFNILPSNFGLAHSPVFIPQNFSMYSTQKIVYYLHTQLTVIFYASVCQSHMARPKLTDTCSTLCKACAVKVWTTDVNKFFQPTTPRGQLKVHAVPQICSEFTNDLKYFIVFCMGKSKGSTVLQLPYCLKLVVIELWLDSYRTLQQLQNSSTVDTFLSDKSICLFNKCVKFQRSGFY